MIVVKPKMIIFDWNETLVYNDINNSIKLFPNAYDVLKKINSMNILISIISNTETVFLKRIIKTLNIDKFIFNVVGISEDKTIKKPNKETVEQALFGSNINEINSENIWMIGNSYQDIQTAYNANIRPVIFGKKLLEIMLFKIPL